jgi:ABC-type multidrug transport system permease subunit
MKFMLRLLCVSALLMILACAVFGFVATFEPMPSFDRMVWRTTYALAGLASLLGTYFALRSLRRVFRRPRSISDPATQKKPRRGSRLA